MPRPSPTWTEAFDRVHRPGTLHAEQHFHTSIDIGNHVAQELIHQAQGRPILDLGAGNGRLLNQLWRLGARDLAGLDTRPRPAELPSCIDWIQSVAPDGVPEWDGLLIAHEFLDDVPVAVIRDGLEFGPNGPVGPARSDDLAWIRRWGGEQSGWRRDRVWQFIVSRVHGTAIAVDWMQPGVVGHLRGRRTRPIVDGRDLSAGVNLRSCRAATGGVLTTQARVLAHHRSMDLQSRSELAVLRDPSGLGGNGWLIVQTDTAP